MGLYEDEEDEEEQLTDEEAKEKERLALLSEEMAARTRMVYNDQEQVWNAKGMRVTDYKHNSRVIFPKHQAGSKESDLEVMRSELLHQHKEWVSKNCNCRGEQPANMSKDEQAGLKSLKKKIADGELVILPTDKSGRFAVLSMNTYITAGMVHVKDDTELRVDEMRANQKLLNGAVSMILKVFRVGKDCRHESRWRESMIYDSLESCPLWLLYTDHAPHKPSDGW